MWVLIWQYSHVNFRQLIVLGAVRAVTVCCAADHSSNGKLFPIRSPWLRSNAGRGVSVGEAGCLAPLHGAGMNFTLYWDHTISLLLSTVLPHSLQLHYSCLLSVVVPFVKRKSNRKFYLAILLTSCSVLCF
jgi:hypothetical protein